MKKEYWEYIGKISIVIGIVIGLLEIYKSFSENKPDVSIAVGHDNFTWPKVLDVSSSIIDDDAKKLLEKIGRKSSFQSVWYAGIHNHGDKEAKSLRLKLPYTYSYRISREGFDTIDSLYKNVISIKDLQPSESVYVIAWSQKNLNDDDLENVFLTHSDGFSDYSRYIEVDGVWKYLYQNGEYIFLFLSIVFIIYVGRDLYKDIRS